MNDSTSSQNSEPVQEKTLRSRRLTTFIIAGIAALAAASVLSFILFAHSYRAAKPSPLTPAQALILEQTLNKEHPTRDSALRPLPYETVPAELDVTAGAAILIDTATGCVIYEKNADELIPPASLTKLMVMFIVHQEIAAHHAALSDIVPLPRESWASSLPSDASRMGLAQGDVVTLDDLMKGLAVVSANDAAIAVADFISGSVPAFVERMNAECRLLRLDHTHFVEPSGYSEQNITTPRDFASFARIYLQRYPESLAEYHSLRELSFPLARNLPDYLADRGDSLAYTFHSTNALLGKLDGCDGLKTGYIVESGFNLALTAQRSGTRFLSVTMRGPGSNTFHGNTYRIKDGTVLMEWAFSSFADRTETDDDKSDGNFQTARSYVLPVTGARGKVVRLVQAWNGTLTVPHIAGKTAREAASLVQVEVTKPAYIYRGIECGTSYGSVVYKLGDTVLQTIPLVADRTLKPAGPVGRLIGRLVSKTLG